MSGMANGGRSHGLGCGRALRHLDPVFCQPAVQLVDRRFPLHQLYAQPLIGAGQRIPRAGDVIGIRGLIVQALSDDAKIFYEHMGFESSPLDPKLLMITLADLKMC